MRHYCFLFFIVSAVGCSTPRPELEEIEARDAETYVDGTGIQQPVAKEKCKVAILVSPGTYKQYGDVAKILEARLTEVFSRLHAFRVVERGNLSELQREQLISGGPSQLADVEADCLMTAKIAAVSIGQSGGCCI